MNTVLWTLLLFALSFSEDFGVASDKACPSLLLSKGMVKYRLKGKLVKFQCYLSYELVGERYGSCINGKWDVVVPNCVRPGCPRFPTLDHGVQLYSRRDAVVMFFCLPNFKLVGAMSAFCDGKQWNGTKPVCVGEKNMTVSTWCNFEDTDLCGWVHDPLHDFDWKRQTKLTPFGYGPSYDHTMGKGNIGHYMFIESSSRLANDTARLLSPLYSAEFARNGCFVFYYHMFGRNTGTGTLRVYLKPQNVDLSSIVSNDSLRANYLMFEKKGYQGNHWYHGFFDFNSFDDNFQIIIEGVRGSNYLNDISIAVDDVAIFQNDKCDTERNKHRMAASSSTFIEDSCSNRCDIQPSDIDFECDCNTDCIIKNTCCVDYRDLCVFDVSTTESVTNKFISETFDPLTLPPPLPTSLMMTQNNVTEDTQTFVQTTTERTSVEYTSAWITATSNAINVSAKPMQNSSDTNTRRSNTFKLTFLTTVMYVNATGLLNRTSVINKQFEYKNIPTTTDAPTTMSYETTASPTRMVPKLAKIIAYSEDAHVAEKVESRPPSVALIVIGVIVTVIALTALATYAFARLRPTSSSVFDNLRNLRRFGVLTTSGSSSDIKFLVQDEELEYDCIE